MAGFLGTGGGGFSISHLAERLYTQRHRVAVRGAAAILHPAPLVAESLERAWKCMSSDVGGTLAVLETARRTGIPRVVIASGTAVYGDRPPRPKGEDHLPAPLRPYGVSKLDGGYSADLHHRMHGSRPCACATSTSVASARIPAVTTQRWCPASSNGP